MAFTNSHVFSSFLNDVIGTNTNAWALSTDAGKVALYNNTTDDATAKFDTLTKNSYNGTSGQFVVANEITGTNWAATGVAPGTPGTAASTTTASLMRYTLANVLVASVTISTAFFGALVYDSTISIATFHPGVCMVAFGGSFTVGGGTLAINWGNDTTSTACVFYITV